MAGVAGSTIGIAGVQPAIGVYVQDAVDPTADTNYEGVNVKVAYATNVLGEGSIDDAVAPQPDWIVPVNDKATAVGTAQWVKSASALIPTDKVGIVAGVATIDNATGTHTCFATVAVGDFFWAVLIA